MDYRALIKDGKQEAGRRTIRHVICLTPSLYSELEDAQTDLQEQRRTDLVSGDKRAGSLSPTGQAEARVAEVEARMTESSVVGVFKALAPDQAAERMDRVNKALEDNPSQSQKIGLEYAKDEILSTFTHFEGRNKERLDLNKEDLQDILDDIMSHGEIAVLANRLNRASTEVHDAPKSVRSSLLNQHSDAT